MMNTITAASNSLTAQQQGFTVTFSPIPDLITRFINYIDRSAKTARTYIVNLRQFVTWLVFSEIKEPVREDIISYRNYLCSEHDAIMLCGNTWQYRTDSSGNRIKVSCKPNTIALYLRSVCQFFKWTAAEGLYPNIAENIRAPKIRHDTHRKDRLEIAEVQTIEKSIEARAAAAITAAGFNPKDTAGRVQRSNEQGKRLYAMYLLTVTAGLRTIELARADIKDLETKNGSTFLYLQGKGHTEKDTRKAIAPEVAEAIQDYLRSRTDNPTSSSPLFCATGNRSGGKRLATTTISTMLKKAMQAAGFNSDKLTAHSLRHTAGSAVMEITGKNLYQTQQYMRHSNPATTEIYLHVDTEKEEAEIAQKLYNCYHGIENQTDSSTQLQEAIQKMNPDQIKQLTAIAKAMSK